MFTKTFGGLEICKKFDPCLIGLYIFKAFESRCSGMDDEDETEEEREIEMEDHKKEK